MRQTATFNCSQQELYLASVIAWQLCYTHLARFARLKAFYTEGYIDIRLADIQTAKAIPNDKMRKDTPTTNHIYLRKAVDACGDYFQALKSLMNTAFEGDLRKTKLDAAGQSFFAKAMSGNQGALNDLNESAIRFIETNTADLYAKNNMTAGFLDEYKAVVADYNALRKAYTDSKKVERDLRKAKTIANNNVHKQMMKMFADAKAVFRKEGDARSQFTFDSVLAQVK